ncbi:hypothetical protein ACX6XY_11690 [Streptomyces sp. O3]
MDQQRPPHAPGPHPGPHPGPAPGFGPPPPAYAPAAQAPAPPPPPYAPGGVPSPDGAPFPEFLAADPHNGVVIDEDGVRLEQHGSAIEFTWPEIRTVHYANGPYGWLLVGVALTDGRFYECRVNAKRQDRLYEWLTEIAPVLDYYLTHPPAGS